MEWLFWFMATAALVNFGYGLKSSSDIYAKLVDVITDKSADAENDFLDKHYFTENKSRFFSVFFCSRHEDSIYKQFFSICFL